LHRSFKLKEMQISMTLIFPFSVAHSFTYIILMLVYLYYMKLQKRISAFDNLAYAELMNLVSFLWIFWVNIFKNKEI
jgi:hypothetical protein